MRRARSLLGALPVLALAGAAEAGTLAKLSDDLNGDGTPEELVLDDTGALRVGGAVRANVKLEPRTVKARLAIAKVPKAPLLVVAASTASQDEAIVLDAKTWRELARFPIGGVGLDREYGVEVDATPTGVYRYQTRWDVRRCDGKPAYLFPERLDGATFRRVAPPTNLPASLPMLAAKVDATAAAPLLYQARGASHRPGARDAGGLAIPNELDDGEPATFWREDLSTSNGEGELFTFTPRVESARAKELRIVPGNPASALAIKAFNRPRSLAIVTAQRAWRVELPDAASAPLGTGYLIELPEPVTGCVTVLLESTYGARVGTTAIAELEIFAEGERAGGGDALLARVVAEGRDGATAAAAALGRRGAAGATAIDAELAKTTDAGARRRLIGALAKITDPAAAPALVRAASSGWVRDQDLIDVIGALAANGQTQALAELAGKGGVPLAIRRAAASKLVPTGAGFDALVELAGKGPRELRHDVIERLALAPAGHLAQAALAQASPPASGDLWRALTRRARSHADERAVAANAMSAALASATDYERRYRLIDGVATYGDADDLRALDALLRGLPVGAHGSALRQVAIGGVASNPRADAIGIVIALAADADPGVRLAALGALATAETDAASPWHGAGGPDGIDRVIINGLATDHWPEVRRRAATALGARCQRPGPAVALTAAVRQDKQLEVRGDALASLVECKATGVRDLLAATWNDGKAPLELRTRAVDLAVALGDPQLASALVGRFTAWRGEAITSTAALALAQSAAAAIGRLGAPGAARVLEDALDDSAFPEIVSAAALGLGALGPACPATAKVKLGKLARTSEQSAAAARRAAAQCGR